MIVFELTMPHCASWNGKWSGSDRRYIRVKHEEYVPKHLWNKDYDYTWSDGWGACVSVKRMPAKEARKLEKLSAGFCGYDWMISSIIKRGYIATDREAEQ